jgi:hypothetical protein
VCFLWLSDKRCEILFVATKVQTKVTLKLAWTATINFTYFVVQEKEHEV